MFAGLATLEGLALARAVGFVNLARLREHQQAVAGEVDVGIAGGQNLFSLQNRVRPSRIAFDRHQSGINYTRQFRFV